MAVAHAESKENEMSYTQHFNAIQKVYIAYYQRPADPAGLRYWAQKMHAAGGDLAAVMEAFVTSKETEQLYGKVNASTIGTVVEAAYQALFHRAPKADGKKYYVDGFANGTFTAGGIVLDILKGARNADATAIDNKLAVANEFTRIVEGRDFNDPAFGSGLPNPAFDEDKAFNATYVGEADAKAARALLAKVTATSTIDSAEQLVPFIKKEIADPGDPILKDAGKPAQAC